MILSNDLNVISANLLFPPTPEPRFHSVSPHMPPPKLSIPNLFLHRLIVELTMFLKFVDVLLIPPWRSASVISVDDFGSSTTSRYFFIATGIGKSASEYLGTSIDCCLSLYLINVIATSRSLFSISSSSSNCTNSFFFHNIYRSHPPLFRRLPSHGSFLGTCSTGGGSVPWSRAASPSRSGWRIRRAPSE